MANIADLRLSRDFKYTALYTALGFFETKQGVYTKKFDSTTITIDSEYLSTIIPGITVIGSDTYMGQREIFEAIELRIHSDFVILECIVRLLTMGYKPEEIIVDEENEYDIYCKNLYIRCYEWGTMPKIDHIKPKKNTFYSIRYESRLVSGVIERNTKIVDYSGNVYDYGIFDSENRLDNYNLYNKNNIEASSDFVIDGDKLVSYKGKEAKVIVPKGIKELGSSAFWDNQYIEEVILPESLVNLGGDTFYNCKNLKRIIIPKNVSKMGNNPFAGCPDLELVNESMSYVYKNFGLYTSDMKKMIYYSIKHAAKSFEIPNTVQIICKHTFFLCDNLETVILPKSLLKMENNPFSGCTKVQLINNSKAYNIINNVIYDKYMTCVCGCLASIDTDCLELESVKKINRNSFWNCKGIRRIILPETLEDIGYNPFVGCSNIEFISKSPEFKVVNGILYNKKMDKIICYPAKLAVGDVHVPDSVIKLERGAFSGCEQMININLHNVSVISKSCFTNCNSLINVYCSDFVSYIGEWAFGHCNNLRQVSIYKDCVVDNNALSSTKANIIRRDNRSNYVIESDNIFTLKMLNDNYKGKFDSILIDPPYNSNIDYIGYNDYMVNKEYIKFMYDRISISYELLSDNGFLVINIDEGGLNLVLKACKKTFSYINVHKWKKLHPYFDVNRNVNPNKKEVLYEYIIICRKNKKTTLNKIMQPKIVNNCIQEYESSVPKVFDCFGTNSSAKDEIKEIFGDRTYFSTPKPVKLIKELIRATTSKDSLIMDFFAGSGTTGHACINLNEEDGGRRNFILVSNSESNICKNVTYKRISMLDSDVVLLD